MQRKEPVASTRFTEAQVQESWSRSAADRVGRRPMSAMFVRAGGHYGPMNIEPEIEWDGAREQDLAQLSVRKHGYLNLSLHHRVGEEP